jgi:hypothetical protein
VLLLIIHEPELMGSLMDLAETLVSYHTTPTNCGRALDTLRRAVAPKLPCKQGWATLRGIVNADKEYMEWVSAYSTNPRHGERRTDIPANIIVEIRKRTWNVMNRMMEYRKGGSKPLDMVKYPMLVHDPSFPLPRS